MSSSKSVTLNRSLKASWLVAALRLRASDCDLGQRVDSEVFALPSASLARATSDSSGIAR
jgi:hypothetical protein